MAEATNSAAVANNDEQTPIIFLDDIHVVFKTRTGLSLIHIFSGSTQSPSAALSHAARSNASRSRRETNVLPSP